MTYDPDRPVITVTPTIMDGTVVRWYGSIDAAERGVVALSASCHGVSVHAAYLTDLPDRWVQHAIQVHRALAVNPSADASNLATHRRRGLTGGVLEPIPDPREQR